MPNRRHYLSLTATAIAAGLAGCAGANNSPAGATTADGTTDARTPTTTATASQDTSEEETTTASGSVNAVIGEPVEGGRLSLVVEDVRRGVDLDESNEASAGNEFALVSLALKNTATEYVTVSNRLQTRLRDDANYTYAPTFADTDAATFTNGQLAPGEVERGDIPFEIPTGASGLDLLSDADSSLFGNLDLAIIDLASEADRIHVLAHSLQVDVYEPGDTVEQGSVQVTITDYRTAESLGDGAEPAADTEYAVVDISITNNSGEQHQLSTARQMLLKDGAGYTYQADIAATSHLNRPFDDATLLGAGETRRGQLVYEAPADASPLYWTFEFGLFASGNKMFWKVQ